WLRLTGKPFVFAFWAIRRDALKHAAAGLDLAAVFQQSRDHGLQEKSLIEIAREWAPKIGIAEHEVRNYLQENIYYQVDGACLEGLGLFYEYAHRCGILPPPPALNFLDTAKPAAI